MVHCFRCQHSGWNRDRKDILMFTKLKELVTSYRINISDTDTDVTIDYIEIRRGIITVKKYYGKELRSFIYGKNNIQKITVKDEKLMFKVTEAPSSLVFKDELVEYINILMTNYTRIYSIIIITIIFGLVMSVITFKYEKNGHFSEKLLKVDKVGGASSSTGTGWTVVAMGVKIEGNRLGLGTNLFSDEKTLAEQYGLEYIDQEFSKSSRFYKKEILGE